VGGLSTISTSQLKAEVEGSGAPMIFVHGLGGSSNSFQTLMPALGGFRCVRPDLPGSARSKLPHEKLNIEWLAQTIIETAQSLAACPGHLVGHSMGTIVCQHVAVLVPEAILSMTLFAPIFEPSEGMRARVRERAQIARGQGMCVVADAVVEAGLSSQTKSQNPLVAAFVRESHMRQDSEGFAQTCEALASATAADLRMIKCPTMLVTGDEDKVAPPSAMLAMAEKIKGAHAHVLERCGHWTMIEKPNECSKLLSAFLRAQVH
jgi:3-oxoadipate enol-lactonase